VRSIARAVARARARARLGRVSVAFARRAPSSTRHPTASSRATTVPVRASDSMSRAPLRLFGEFRLVHEILARVRAEIFLDAVSRAHRRERRERRGRRVKRGSSAIERAIETRGRHV